MLACEFDEKNHFSIPVDESRKLGLNEEQFHAVIDKIERIYAPLAAAQKGKLTVVRKWSDSAVNARAMRSGKVWKVELFGGLARHEAMTYEGFALVACHEIGHLFGGAPSMGSILTKPVSIEGQADYFATTKCLRKFFLDEDNADLLRDQNVPNVLKQSCSQEFGHVEDQNICLRSGVAALAMAQYFALTKNIPAPRFETPDTSKVKETLVGYPSPQCRLDTYFHGSLCEVSFTEDFSLSDPSIGSCHQKRGHIKGLRPVCWFKAVGF